MIVIQHAAPMASRSVLLYFPFPFRANIAQTKYLWEQAHAYHISGAQAARSFNMKQGRCVTTQTTHVAEIRRFWPGHGTVTLP